MKARLIAITAAGLCLVAGAAQAQMPADAQELVQTMRPMQVARTAPAPQDDSKQAASTDDTSYGGAAPGQSMAGSGGHRPGACSAAPNCDIFFGQ